MTPEQIAVIDKMIERRQEPRRNNRRIESAWAMTRDICEVALREKGL